MIIFDIVLLAVVLGGGYYGYKNENLDSIYRILKIIVSIAISSKYALDFAMWLTGVGILKAETFAVLILLGFLFIMVFFWTAMFFLEIIGRKFLIVYINRNKKKISSVFSAIEFFIIFTLSLFLILQFSWPRKSVKPLLQKSYTYMYIHNFYKSFLNDKFVNEVFLKGNAFNAKELILEMGSSYLNK